MPEPPPVTRAVCDEAELAIPSDYYVVETNHLALDIKEATDLKVGIVCFRHLG